MVHIVSVSAYKNNTIIPSRYIQVWQCYIIAAFQINSIVIWPLQRAGNSHVINNNILNAPVKWTPVCWIAEPKVWNRYVDCVDKHNTPRSAFSLTFVNSSPNDRHNLVLYFVVAGDHLPHRSRDDRIQTFTDDPTVSDIFCVNYIPKIPVVRVISNVIWCLNESACLQIQVNIAFKLDGTREVSSWWEYNKAAPVQVRTVDCLVNCVSVKRRIVWDGSIIKNVVDLGWIEAARWCRKRDILYI